MTGEGMKGDMWEPRGTWTIHQRSYEGNPETDACTARFVFRAGAKTRVVEIAYPNLAAARMSGEEDARAELHKLLQREAE